MMSTALINIFRRPKMKADCLLSTTFRPLQHNVNQRQLPGPLKFQLNDRNVGGSCQHEIGHSSESGKRPVATWSNPANVGAALPERCPRDFARA